MIHVLSLSLSQIFISVSIGALVTVFAISMLFKMSAFDGLIVGSRTSLVILLIVEILVLHVVERLALTKVVAVTAASLVHVVAPHAVITTSSPQTSHISSTSSILLKSTSASGVLLLLLAYLLLLGFEGNCHLFGGHRVIWLSQFFLTMGEMTPVSERTIIVLLEMSAKVCFVFIIDLVF